MIPVDVVSFGGDYRLATCGQFVGVEDYCGSHVLCIGDEVCEQLGYERDSLGYVFETKAAAAAARARVVNAVWSFRRAE